MANFDRQTDEWGSQNLKEKEEEGKKETYREMVVLLKWNLNNWIFYLYALFILIVKYSGVI